MWSNWGGIANVNAETYACEKNRWANHLWKNLQHLSWDHQRCLAPDVHWSEHHCTAHQKRHHYEWMEACIWVYEGKYLMIRKNSSDVIHSTSKNTSKETMILGNQKIAAYVGSYCHCCTSLCTCHQEPGNIFGGWAIIEDVYCRKALYSDLLYHYTRKGGSTYMVFHKASEYMNLFFLDKDSVQFRRK